jgi:hypothetical protein
MLINNNDVVCESVCGRGSIETFLAAITRNLVSERISILVSLSPSLFKSSLNGSAENSERLSLRPLGRNSQKTFV